MYKLLTSKRLQNFVLLGFLAVSAKSVDAGRTGTASCDAPNPLGVIERPDFPREFSNFPTPFQPESSPSPMAEPSTVGEPSSNGNIRGGGFGDLNLISGSRGGDSFAALAPGTYIDNAVISNMFRFRVDAGYNNFLPDRAEFFYGQCGCFGGNAPGPGSPGNPGIANRSVDYQEFVPYFERALSGNFSMFAETPFRLINPDVTENTGGLSDINAGIKASLLSCNHQYLTAQFRVYAPTGDARSGLGNGHTSLEPGLLYLGRKSDRLILQSEFRVWIPLSDSRTQDGRDSSPIRVSAPPGPQLWRDAADHRVFSRDGQCRISPLREVGMGRLAAECGHDSDRDGAGGQNDY